MTGTLIPKKIQPLLKDLTRSQLVDIDFEPKDLGMRLEFMFGDGEESIIIQLFQLVHWVMSKQPDDNDGCFFVGEVAIASIEDGGKDILSSLLYRFKERDGSVATYRSRSLFHFHLEGAVCIEAVCGAYQVFQQIKDE